MNSLQNNNVNATAYKLRAFVLTSVVLSIAMAMASEMIAAQSVTNQYKEALTVIWRAVGSVGISKGVTVVCNSQDVAPGQTVAYQFIGGTIYRQIRLKAPVIVNRAATMICQITMRSLLTKAADWSALKKYSMMAT